MKEAEYNGYKVGALKRKFKLGKGDFAPGTLINKMNEAKQQKPLKEVDSKTKLAIKGLV